MKNKPFLFILQAHRLQLSKEGFIILKRYFNGLKPKHQGIKRMGDRMTKQFEYICHSERSEESIEFIKRYQ